MKKIIPKFFKLLVNDSLYKNSIYLMLSTAVSALLGFFFWIINAHLYSAEQVGIGTTLISIMTLISGFSTLGLGNGLIKYLPTSEIKNKKINTSFTIVSLMSFLISVIYLIFLKTFSPKLLFVRENIIFSLLFILFIVFSSLGTLSDSIFIAYRSSKFVLMENTISSITKLILTIFLVGVGAYAIFMSVGIAIIVYFVFALIILTLKYNYLFKPTINKDIIKRIAKFSLGNYVAGFIGGLPAMILPIIIINLIGAEFSAYFYMALMVANLLYIIPSSVSQSLFAEGSHQSKELKKNVIKTLRMLYMLIVPAIILIVFLGKYLLLAFGKNYSEEGFRFLQLLAISGIFTSANYVLSAILNIKGKVNIIISMCILGTTLTLGLSYLLVGLGLLGIGIAWITSQIITSLIYAIISLRYVK